MTSWVEGTLGETLPGIFCPLLAVKPLVKVRLHLHLAELTALPSLGCCACAAGMDGGR